LLKCRNDEQLKQWLGFIINLKKTTPTAKIDLISAPQTPRMEYNHPLLHYDEDEEDEEYHDNMMEDMTEESFMRNRSYSYQYNHPQNTGRGYEVSTRKASLPSTPLMNKHYLNGIPGMTLPPLPRSPTTNLPTLSNTSSVDSIPPSPTHTPTITPSGELWQRRQQVEKEEKHVRARSLSSPNISRPPPQVQPKTPDLPLHYQQQNKRKSNGYKFIDQPVTEDITKVKVHYFGAIYVVVVPTDIEFNDLQKRIESKIKLCGQEFQNFGLKYQDEDGDLITISSSEDVQMGFENKGPNNAVNLYVT
jgi:cell division control protein 24